MNIGEEVKIVVDNLPYSSLRFYKGVFGDRKFEVCLDVNFTERRRKINFYADGAKYTEAEKIKILEFFGKQFNEETNETKLIEE